MARPKKTVKAKEPVRIRFKELKNGNKSIYLDIYRDGKRTYEFLKLYRLPEINARIKEQNRATLAAVEAIKPTRLRLTALFSLPTTRKVSPTPCSTHA